MSYSIQNKNPLINGSAVEEFTSLTEALKIKYLKMIPVSKTEGNRDNRKMIFSLLPLMSVLTLERVPALDYMCTDIIRHILQVLTILILID